MSASAVFLLDLKGKVRPGEGDLAGGFQRERLVGTGTLPEHTGESASVSPEFDNFTRRRRHSICRNVSKVKLRVQVFLPHPPGSE